MNETDVFRLALRASPDPTTLSRLRDGQLVEASDSFCRLTGFDREDLVGRRITETGLWVDPGQAERLAREVGAAGAAHDFEARLRTRAGEQRIHRIRATRVDAAPEPLLLAVGHDLSPTHEAGPGGQDLRYRGFVDAMPVGVLVTQHGQIKYANPQAAELSGYSIDELVGHAFMPLIHEEDRERVTELHRRRMAGEVAHSTYQLRLQRRDGGLRHLKLSVQTVDWEGSRSGLSLLTDITEQVLTEQRLRELSSIVEQTSDAIMLTSTDGSIQYVNPGFERLTGWRRDEVIGRTPAMFKSGAHDPDFYRQLWKTIAAGRPFQGQVVNRRKDGSEYHAVKSITPMFDAAGRIVSYVNIDKDFTEQHAAQQRTVHLALHDPLTGLANRSLLTDRLGQALAHCERDGAAFALLFLDLDGFKAINDRQGHQAGDVVLKEVARRLSERARSVDTVARIGGDEFVVLLAGVGEPDLASAVASQLIAAIREPIALAGGPCSVGASVGIGVFPRDGADVDTLLRSADDAMYRAKRGGGDRVQFASPA